MKVNLKEYIHPEMDILFVALNAPMNSNNNGHWFTNNLSFWNLIYRAGIITAPVTNMLDGDEKVFGDTSINVRNLRIGVTDLIRSIVETDSTRVEPQAEDVHRILNILDRSKVDKLCLMHSKVGEAFKKYSAISFNHNRYGKIGKYGKTDIYEVPFHNAPVPNKDSYYAELVGRNLQHPQNMPSISKPIITERQNPPVTKSLKSFILPKPGNNITEKDIQKGQIRITVDFKGYFPRQSQLVKIKYLGKNKTVNYTYREERSSLLNVGQDFMEKLRVNPKSRLKISLQEDKFIFFSM